MFTVFYGLYAVSWYGVLYVMWPNIMFWFGILKPCRIVWCCVPDDKAEVPPPGMDPPRYGGRQVKSGWQSLLSE